MIQLKATRVKEPQELGHSGDSGSTALVIGGSVAGLMAARVLSQHYEHVKILERDPVGMLPESRKGQPHTRHTHVLLAKGLEIMKHYFPGFEEQLTAGGAEIVDFTEHARWHVGRGMAKQHFGRLPYVLASRPYLESIVRRFVLDLDNVELIDGCKILDLIIDKTGGRVTGVHVELRGEDTQEQWLAADLVVDASGRGSKASVWLEQHGFEPPQEERIEIGVGYATRTYQRSKDDLQDGRLICVLPVGPHETRGGCLIPMEGDRWICTLAGWGGDHAGKEAAEFMSYAESLPSPEIAEALKRLQPIDEILTYKYPSSLRRHYERIRRHPEGFIALGDSICSFNPIFGQGMTSTCCQALVLDEILTSHGTTGDFWKMYYKRAAKYIDRAWMTAAAADFQYPLTTGKKPLGTDLLNFYTALINEASHESEVVFGSFIQVTNLMRSPASLLRPRILFRVLAHAFKRRCQSFFGVRASRPETPRSKEPQKSWVA